MSFAGQTVHSSLPLVASITPMAGSLLVYFAGLVNDRARNAVAIAIAALTLVLVLMMYPQVNAGLILEANYGEFLPPLGISFRVDLLSFFLAGLSAFIWLLATVYSLEYMQGEHGTNRYYSFLTLTLAGALGTFLAGDLFTLFLFFEFMSLPAYILVVHEETDEAMRAGLKYLFMTIGGGLCFFFALVATYELGGTVTLGQVGLIKDVSLLSALAFVGYLIAFGMKAGMVPLHVWLSDAHPVAPSPASALLSGIMIKTGAYGLLRVIYGVYGPEFMARVNWPSFLLAAAAITILLGSAVAIMQQDIKRRLAYSSIGQMGYILLGMSLLTERALTGDIFHIFAHAFMKACLFLAAGAVIKRTGKRLIADYAGIGFKMPVTMGCFTVAALTMVGIPPLNGFISKWEIALGAFDAGKPLFAFLLVVSSLMNAVYYFPIIISAYFGRPAHDSLATGHEGSGSAEAPRKWLEPSWGMLLPMLLLAAGCFAFVLFPNNWPFAVSAFVARLLLHP
ncbi:MAG: proton-conducting transporter membrane subunit [Bacillota bacterium]